MKTTTAGKKKIIFTEYFSTIGGGQVVLLNMVKRLKKNFEIRVVLFNRGQLEKELYKLGIQTHFIQSPKTVKHRYLWDSLPFLTKFTRYLQAEQPDAVFANNYFSVKLSALPAKINRIPLIWHKHIIMEKNRSSYISGQLRLYAGLTDTIICVSDAVKKSMQAVGVPAAKLVTVHNGIELEKKTLKASALIKKKFNIGKAFVFGTLGFIRKNKGFDLFVKAAELALLKQKNIKFLAVGKADKPDKKFEEGLKNYVKAKGLEKKIIFTGFGDKRTFMKAFDVFVLPSFCEPFGLVTVEAMAQGLPVIAFGTGGTPEIITDGVDGFLTKDIGEHALAEKMLEVYNNRKKLGTIKRNAAATVRARFTAGLQAEKIRKIIEETAAKER